MCPKDKPADSSNCLSVQVLPSPCLRRRMANFRVFPNFYLFKCCALSLLWQANKPKFEKEGVFFIIL